MSQTRSCFIISPIGQAGSAVRNHADDVYRFIISPALEKFGITPERSDEISETGRITEQMFERIFHADVCVVVLTGLNPNVFYELAVAQCAARPTVLLAEKGQELPFDIKDLRCIEYQLEPISRLVDGYYVAAVQEQLEELTARNWSTPSLFEQFSFSPKLQTEQQVRRLLRESRPQAPTSMPDCHFPLPGDSQRGITIVTGDLMELADSGRLKALGVDAIVSLENTYFQLDNFFATSMSGKLRYLDAGKTSGGRLDNDALRQELDKQVKALDIVLPAAPGTTIPTGTHALAEYGVKAVLHVAGTVGVPGKGYRLLDDEVVDCVRGVFDTFHRQAEAMQLQAVLLPMIGSFMAELEQREVVRRILRIVLLRMEQLQVCSRVFLLAWNESQRSALLREAKAAGLETSCEQAEGEQLVGTEGRADSQ